MSLIIGNGNPFVNFSVSPGATFRFFWFGFNGANIGFPIGPSLFTLSNRIVATGHGMEFMETPDFIGNRFTLDVVGEDTTGTGIDGVFRMQIGFMV
jgi:hypothetical protein